jgi:DNA-binding NarL/FixJ family response regulator
MRYRTPEVLYEIGQLKNPSSPIMSPCAADSCIAFANCQKESSAAEMKMIKDFRSLDRAARILVVSAREDPLSIQRTFRAGTHGYFVLEDDSSEILQALERISEGHLYASATVMRRLLKSLASKEIEPARSEVRALSDRELQVFSLIGRGFGASRLATELHLSVKTIETYQAHIKEKLGLNSAAELSEKAAHWTVNSMRRNLQLRKLVKTAS